MQMLPVGTAVLAAGFQRSWCDLGGRSERPEAGRAARSLGSDTGTGCAPGVTAAADPGSCVGGGAGGASGGRAGSASAAEGRAGGRAGGWAGAG